MLRNACPCIMVLVCLLVLLASPNPAFAQVLYGSLIGNVTDQSGGAVSGRGGDGPRTAACWAPSPADGA